MRVSVIFQHIFSILIGQISPRYILNLIQKRGNEINCNLHLGMLFENKRMVNIFLHHMNSRPWSEVFTCGQIFVEWLMHVPDDREIYGIGICSISPFVCYIYFFHSHIAAHIVSVYLNCMRSLAVIVPLVFPSVVSKSVHLDRLGRINLHFKIIYGCVIIGTCHYGIGRCVYCLPLAWMNYCEIRDICFINRGDYI